MIENQLAVATSAGADPYSTNQANALIHLYRAEVGKMTAYRVRLDTTTNWAISSSAVVATLTLGTQAVPHAAFLFLMALICFFLYLEARRFKAYEASRYRVVLLEQYFFDSVFSEGEEARPAGWRKHLLSVLREPLGVSTRGALGWRLRRSYLWIYTAVMLTWIVRLDVGAVAGESWVETIARASVGPIPGLVVAALVAAFYVSLVALALGARAAYPLGDEEATDLLRVTERF